MKVKLVKDAETGEVYLPIPDEVMTVLGWEVGMHVVIEVWGDGMFIRRHYPALDDDIVEET